MIYFDLVDYLFFSVCWLNLTQVSFGGEILLPPSFHQVYLSVKPQARLQVV